MRLSLAVLMFILGIAAVIAAVPPSPFMGGRNNAIKGDSTHSMGIAVPQASLFNLVTNFGAACNGVADDGPAFAAAGAGMPRSAPRH